MDIWLRVDTLTKKELNNGKGSRQMSERVTLTLIPSERYRNNTSTGKYDLIVLKDVHGKEYRYNLSAKPAEEQQKLDRAIGGRDAITGHYCEVNKTPIKITAILEINCGYTWLIQPRLAHPTMEEIRKKRSAKDSKKLKAKKNNID